MIITEVIAQNVKSIREEKKLTLEMAAAITGVSRSMLSQIEKGDVNPTISVLWKIAEGYKIPFAMLMDQKQPQTTLIRMGDTISVPDNDEKFMSRVVFPFDKSKQFETHSAIILPGGVHHSMPHLSGTEEFITVYSGEVEISIEEEVFQLKEGDSIHFHADKEHIYKNTGKKTVIYHDVIFYK